jgi:hypothetical protein
MTLTELLDLISPSKGRTAIETLVKQKASLPESHEIKPVPKIEELIASLRLECENTSTGLPSGQRNMDDLDVFFRNNL